MRGILQIKKVTDIKLKFGTLADIRLTAEFSTRTPSAPTADLSILFGQVNYFWLRDMATRRCQKTILIA
jgi:hypothetical protein